MSFLKIKSLDHLVKIAEEELLLASITVSDNGETSVTPVKCPGVGRKSDYGKADGDAPACIFKGRICPYFSGAQFTFEDYIKRINCRAI